MVAVVPSAVVASVTVVVSIAALVTAVVPGVVVGNHRVAVRCPSVTVTLVTVTLVAVSLVTVSLVTVSLVTVSLVTIAVTLVCAIAVIDKVDIAEVAVGVRVSVTENVNTFNTIFITLNYTVDDIMQQNIMSLIVSIVRIINTNVYLLMVSKINEK